MAKYQQYEEYKDSTVIWLKDLLPKTWTLSRIKYLCYVNDGNHGEEYPKESDYTDSQNGVPFIRGGNLGNYAITDEGMLYITHIKNNSMRKGRLKKGDILFVNRGEIGKLALVTEKHAGSNLNSQIAYLRVNNNKLINKYLLYYLDSSYVSNFLVSMKMGSVLTQFPIGDLLDIHVPLPLAEEQIQIANFLDHETAQIDTLIEKQQTLIQLLKEKRQAVISHAVTKGLNPDAPMKDSGVEWLGEVPEHWDIVKLKWKASTTSGGTPTTSKYEDYYEDGDIPWIRTTDLNNDKLNETPIMITPKAVRDSACSLLPKNSVLIAMYGGAGSIGKHSLLNFESTINQAVCGVLPSDAFVPDYLHRFYEFYRPFWMIGAAGTRKDPNIGQDNIKEARVPIPPLSEQHQIADYLDKMQSHFDALTESAEKGIQLMQERRTALISAAVTGKIDVRGWRVPE